MSFRPLGDLEEDVDFKTTWLDLVGEIRVTDKELDAIISADDAGREEEYLAYNGDDTIDDVITCEDDVIDSGDEISTVDKEAYMQSVTMGDYF